MEFIPFILLHNAVKGFLYYLKFYYLCLEIPLLFSIFFENSNCSAELGTLANLHMPVVGWHHLL